MDENIRFIQVLDMLKSKGEISSYKQASEVLRTNKAGISDIKNGRKGVSIALLRGLKLSYESVNLEWIITGKGTPFITINTQGVDETTLKLIEKLTQQAEEIGNLKTRLSRYEKP